MNVADALKFAAGALRDAGVPEDRTTGALLLGHVLGVGRVALVAHPERPLSDAEERAFREAVARRASGVPFQHIAGVQEFYGLEFEVSPDVLIPRPETEAVVEIARRLAPASVLDVGTGSGCIAVSLAVVLPGARVAATDLSAPALRVARRNAARHGARVGFVRCDLASAVGGPFDVVASNPPYVPEADRDGLQREVRDHEPHLALFGGAEGLDVYGRLFADAPRLLAPGGRLVCEIGVGQSGPLAALADRLSLVVERVEDDLAGIPRTMVLCRKAN